LVWGEALEKKKSRGETVRGKVVKTNRSTVEKKHNQKEPASFEKAACYRQDPISEGQNGRKRPDE